MPCNTNSRIGRYKIRKYSSRLTANNLLLSHEYLLYLLHAYHASKLLEPNATQCFCEDVT